MKYEDDGRHRQEERETGKKQYTEGRPRPWTGGREGRRRRSPEDRTHTGAGNERGQSESISNDTISV